MGDLAHHMQVEDVNKIIEKLNGRKILIKGNHDKKYDAALLEEVGDFQTISLNGNLVMCRRDHGIINQKSSRIMQCRKIGRCFEKRSQFP